MRRNLPNIKENNVMITRKNYNNLIFRILKNEGFIAQKK